MQRKNTLGKHNGTSTATQKMQLPTGYPQYNDSPKINPARRFENVQIVGCFLSALAEACPVL